MTKNFTPPTTTSAEFAHDYLHNLRTTQGVDLSRASKNDLYQALGLTVRGMLMQDWMDRLVDQLEKGPKVVAYLSAEYLLGPQLLNTLLAYDIETIVRDGLNDLNLDLDELVELEPEPGLGNGGLGRLAACYIDSLATLGIPAVGYGIRYEYGIFRQVFEEGRQVELPDKWLRGGNPWEFSHSHMSQTIGFGGYTESYIDELGRHRTTWVPDHTVNAVPFNYLVPGYRNGAVNTLRLWASESPDEFNLSIFNRGDYVDAVGDQVKATNLSKVLYPEDSTPQGKELRLSQQYFFTAASIRDFIDQTLPDGFDLAKLPERVVFQLNDTHPVIGIPELMRILLDEEGMMWEDAWDITTKTFNYTCHTLLPEALEVWSVDLIESLLPRHMEIIYEINSRFLEEVAAQYPGDNALLTRMSIIQEEPWRGVRMAHLAVVGSTKVNGVAELQSQLLRERVLHDFSMMTPEKFTNVTNGVSPRRFLRVANPGLSKLITDTIGPGWERDLDRLEGLVPYADDASFREEFAAVKRANKARLASVLADRDGISIDPTSMYDVMIKRLHEYKRQIMMLLHIVTLYQRIKADPSKPIVPRTFVFGAKAAPGYLMAKQTIEVILAVAKAIDSDPVASRYLRIAFPANYNVVLNQVIVPATELSEQISMAGKEASGTGNMKFALNGALTIGTLDGANVEIEQLVGSENFFLFGLTVDEVIALQESGYRPRDFYERDQELHRAIDALEGDVLLGAARDAGHAVISHLMDHDPFLVFADYRSYVDAQDRVSAAYLDPEQWNRMAILNVAQTGFFSSDRSMQDYLDRIWHATAG